MSGRAATNRITDHARTCQPIRGYGWVAACALAVVAAAVPAGSAQPPTPPIQPPADDRDPRSPLPPPSAGTPDDPARFAIPNPDRRIFAGIQDDDELQPETKNGDEYAAYHEVVRHARQFTAAELERHALRDLVRDDLTHQQSRQQFRLALVRFEGKLTKFRKVRLTRTLAGDWLAEQARLAAGLGLPVSADDLAATGVLGVYQGWLVPAGELESRPVCVVFTDLPPGIAPPANLGEWVSVDRWAVFAGYSFKLLAYPGPNAADPKDPGKGGWQRAPLLVGVSFTPTPEPPPEIPLNKNLRIFQKIADDAPMTEVRPPNDPRGESWEEAEAWHRVLFHARRFSPEQLEQAARRDLGFADLFKDVRRDYKLDLVYLEGRLALIKDMTPTKRMEEAGVPTAYEGWLYPKGQPPGQEHPVCVIVTEIPDGVELGKKINVPVAFAGYSFKLMWYDSRDTDEKAKRKKAPLLIGRALRRLDEAPTTNIWTTTFVPVVVGGIVLLAGTALLLHRWFRRGDQRVMSEVNSVRQRNPFET